MKEIREKYKKHCDKMDEIVESVNKTTELIKELVALGKTNNFIVDSMVSGIAERHSKVVEMFLDNEEDDIYG